MSLRHLRRLQKPTIAEIPAVKDHHGAGGEDEDQEEEQEDLEAIMANQVKAKKGKKGKKSAALPPTANPFDLLVKAPVEDHRDPRAHGGDVAEADEEAQEEEEEEEAQEQQEEQGTNGSSKSKSKKKKKNKGKKKGSAAEGDGAQEDTSKAKGKGKALDQIDQALLEINQRFGSSDGKNGPQAQTGGPRSDLSEGDIFRQFLSADARNFDPNAELRKLFGSKIINSESKKRAQPRSLKKTLMVTPSDTWPPVDKAGCGMDLIETKFGISFFKFTHSRQYQEIQIHFYDCVESLDPNNIMNLLRSFPYHVDSLLTLSEVCRQSGDGNTATDLIERALFAIEKSLHPLFNLTTASSRLPFERAENRSFYLALFRHIQSVTRKGCWRTALEFSKLLLSLDPLEDPYGVFLMIDFFALRSGEYEWILKIQEALKKSNDLLALPNWSFSSAVAKFHLESKTQSQDHTESSLMLQNAILKFPSAVSQIAEVCKTGVGVSQPLFSKPLDPNASEKGVEFLISVFLEWGSSTWKEPEIQEWWKKNARACHNLIQEQDFRVAAYEEARKNNYAEISTGVYRHVIVSDFGKIVPNIPPEVMQGSMTYMHDPLPPANSTSDYTRPERPQLSPEASQEERYSIFDSIVRALFPHLPAEEGAEADEDDEEIPE